MFLTRKKNRLEISKQDNEKMYYKKKRKTFRHSLLLVLHLKLFIYIHIKILASSIPLFKKKIEPIEE